MNPYEYKPTPEPVDRRNSILASEGWHRFVTILCLCACLGVMAGGVNRLGDPTNGASRPARVMDYAAGFGLALLGLSGCIFLVRQLRPRPNHKRQPR